MMTNDEIIKIAMNQCAKDMMCEPEAFLSEGVLVIPMTDCEAVRKRGQKKSILSFMTCNMVYWGKGIVCTCDSRIVAEMKRAIHPDNAFRNMELCKLYEFNDILAPLNKQINCMANYLLPDVTADVSVRNDLEICVLRGTDIARLYGLDGFHNALDYGSCVRNDGRRKDSVAVVCTVDGTVAGVAGATDDCDSMWQIGIDVLPEFRRQGIASALVKRCAEEVFAEGKVPYYCSAWSNVLSRKTARAAGFYPAWVEIACVGKDS